MFGSFTEPFNFIRHFPGGPGLAGTRMSPFWILSELRMVLTTGTETHAKLQSNLHHQQTNAQPRYRPDALSVTWTTVLKHCRNRQFTCAHIKHWNPPASFLNNNNNNNNNNKLMKKIGVWSSTNPGGQKTKNRRAKAPRWSAGWRLKCVETKTNKKKIIIIIQWWFLWRHNT